MNVSLKNKLIEIVVDKGLVGLLILLVGFQINGSLERYKLVEAQRVGDTSEVVKSCADIWVRVYEYEDNLGEIDRLKSQRWIVQFFGQKDQRELAKNITEKESKGEQEFQEINRLITERRFVIGDELARHFALYIGLLKMRADARVDSREAANEEFKKDAKEMVKSLDKQLATMRFTAMMAREHAVSKLPR